MKNLRKTKIAIIAIAVIITIVLIVMKLTGAKAVTVSSEAATSNRNFDVKGYDNGVEIKTTYDNRGYYTVLSVNGAERMITNMTNGVLDGVTCRTILTPVSDNRYIKITYELNNQSGQTKTVGVATHADIQIGSNDSAPISNLSGDRGVSMYDEGKYNFVFLGRKAYGVTDVDTYWFGHYTLSDENKWSDSREYVPRLDHSVPNDCGIAFSWKNRTIAPGETQSYSALIGIGELNEIPTIRVTGSLEDEYSSGDKVNIKGYVKDLDVGDRLTIRYAIDGGTENTITTITANGRDQEFSGNYTIPSNMSSGRHFFEVWVLDDKGNVSEPVKKYFTVSSDTEAPTATHTLNPTEFANGNVEITVTATDSATLPSSYSARIEKSTDTVTITSEGIWYIHVKARDKLLNTTSDIVKGPYKIDRTPPMENISHTPVDWVIDYVTINWEFTDDQSGMDYCILPDGTRTNDTSGRYVVGDNGNYTFKAYDRLGNEKIVTEPINNIDKISPGGVLTVNNNELTDNSIQILWEVYDRESGFSKIILPDSTVSNSATGSFPISQMGEYSFVVYDKVGNDKKLNIIVNNVDMEKPKLTVTQEVTRWTNEDILLDYEAIDNQSGIREVVFPNSLNTSETKGKYVVTKNGEYTFLAYDKIGNGIMVTHKVSNIDKTPPVLKLKRSYDNDDNIRIT